MSIDGDGASGRRVYVVDDDAGVLESFRFMLEAAGFVVAGYSRAEDLIREVATLPPGVLVVDVRLPGLSGLEMIGSIRASHCYLPAIVMSGLNSVAVTLQAFGVGAITFIPKPATADALLVALDEAFTRLPALLTYQDARRRLATLTPREMEVFTAVSNGSTSGEIGEALGISARTVEVYRHDIQVKLAAPTIADLVKLKVIAARPPE